MKIFWINLHSNISRKLFMEKQLNNYNLLNERFEAIIPQQIKDICDFSNESKLISKNSEIACMCSHLQLIFNEKNNDNLIIMEDDIEINSNILNLNNFIEKAPEDWEILQFHYINFEDINLNIIWKEWKSNYYSTAFYVINKKGIEKIINRFFNNSKINFMNLKESIKADKLIYETCNTYTINKPIFFTNTDFKSNIQTEKIHNEMFKMFNKKYKNLQ